MKRIRLALFTVLAINFMVAMVASAKGLLPSMVYRRGLTNEQIDRILEAHPDAQLRITAQDWAAMKYQLCRFDNMTNYVEEIGGSNDCARVLLRLHDRGEELASSNSVLLVGLKSERLNTTVAVKRAQEYADAYADATNRAASVLALFTAATNRAAVAEAKVARTEAFKAWLAGHRDNAVLPSTKAIYQSIIDRLEEN